MEGKASVALSGLSSVVVDFEFEFERRNVTVRRTLRSERMLLHTHRCLDWAGLDWTAIVYRRVYSQVGFDSFYTSRML